MKPMSNEKKTASKVVLPHSQMRKETQRNHSSDNLKEFSKLQLPQSSLNPST
jgi:hypothetical protein